MSENPHPTERESAADSWLDRLLDGSLGADEMDHADAALAEVFASVTAPTTEADLVGLDVAVAAFVAAHPSTPAPARAPSRLRFGRRLLALPAAALAASLGVLTIGGLAAAAYAGVLPPALQDIAHHSIGAPASHHAASSQRPAPADGPASTLPPGRQESSGPAAPGSTTPGPPAAGPASLGLCQAFLRGHLAEASTAYRSLEVAAGGQGATAYCDGVIATGRTSGPAAHQPTPVPARTPVSPPAGMPGTTPAGHAPSPPSTTPPGHPGRP